MQVRKDKIWSYEPVECVEQLGCEARKTPELWFTFGKYGGVGVAQVMWKTPKAVSFRSVALRESSPKGPKPLLKYTQ